MASTYKLYHFDTRYLADPIRFIFLFAKVPFEDIRLGIDEWQEMKSKTPWEQLPMLELPDGRVMGQSGAISEYLAKSVNLIGDTEFDLIRCREISETLKDIRQEWRKVFFQKNRDRMIACKHTFIDLITKKYLPQFADMQVNAGGGLFLVCNRVTYADLTFAQNVSYIEETLGIDLIEQFPTLKQLKDTVLEFPEIKEYMEQKPSKNDISILNHIHIAN